MSCMPSPPLSHSLAAASLSARPVVATLLAWPKIWRLFAARLGSPEEEVGRVNSVGASVRYSSHYLQLVSVERKKRGEWVRQVRGHTSLSCLPRPESCGAFNATLALALTRYIAVYRFFIYTFASACISSSFAPKPPQQTTLCAHAHTSAITHTQLYPWVVNVSVSLSWRWLVLLALGPHTNNHTLL